MQLDFHYYATYCAAFLAGYTHEESLRICTAAQYTDCCTATALKKMKAPLAAATTQSQAELMDAKPGVLGLQDITRIWASFHFLPRDLYAEPGRGGRSYRDKYRLICGPNSDLLAETVRLAKRDGSPEAVGLAMHILADTWAHRYFAGTPSLVINNVGGPCYEILESEGEKTERLITFRHKVTGEDDPAHSLYTASVLQYNEHSVMNLGHGRAGHLPDYCFARYRYLPAWGDYAEIVKDNPSDYLHAFAQMVYAMQVMREPGAVFEKDTYAWETIEPMRRQLEDLFRTRRLDASKQWKGIGEMLSGEEIPDFSDRLYEQEYLKAPAAEKDDTAPGRYFYAALSQKSMVTKRIFDSGNLLAGFSVDYFAGGFRGIKDFRKLLGRTKGGAGQ